jgi:hypothetical protein
MHCMEANMKPCETLWRRNRRSVISTWGSLGQDTLRQLKLLTTRYFLSVGAGELQLLNGHWYVTHAGLLGIAQRKRCSAIKTTIVENLCEPSTHRWVFRAIVYKTSRQRGFVGYGDADPSNVSSMVRGAEMRVAETRAVNRALRKAYGIGLCSVEELGSFSGPPRPIAASPRSNDFQGSNGTGNGNGHVRLRDQLCLLIRKYDLDPVRVKRYAADFCGTEVLRDAGRDLVESFITTLADQAAKDRDGLICKLNSYGNAEAVKS